MLCHVLGFPRIGSQRELKNVCERYWKGDCDQAELVDTGRKLRLAHWQLQRDAGMDLIACNDFSFYDQVLDMTVALGGIPQRYRKLPGASELDLYFAMARGYQRDGADLTAMEMTKWFDTNYHYIVPEFHKGQRFSVNAAKAVGELKEAKALGVAAKPVLIGPVSYLMLGKEKDAGFHRLELLEELLPAYLDLLKALEQAGADWIQIDEPFLALDLDPLLETAYIKAFGAIKGTLPDLRILLATYFAPLRENIDLALSLPVQGLHLDLVRGAEQLDAVLEQAPAALQLSLGLVDGRNIWKHDISRSVELVARVQEKIGSERIMIAPSCSLLHVPYDTELERKARLLPEEIRQWLSFAKQKLYELSAIASLAQGKESTTAQALLEENKKAIADRGSSRLIHIGEVRERVAAIRKEELQRSSPFPQRQPKQHQKLKLPLFPTTTIGSFPQTAEVRRVRSQLAQGKISQAQYEAAIEQEMAQTIRLQEELGLDLLVHGEFERNDMVQYFGEQLEGCCFTSAAWVQSFGSRCVRPPVIFGDVRRKGAMTVSWSSLARSLTQKPVKGMLTGPVTVLQWSFVRDDQPRRDTALQIALAIRDEVQDLEQAGIGVIQIDEPAFREGLPLRKGDREQYLHWATESFRLATSRVRDETQIHTHMCYSEFNDVIANIAEMDADVITIESSRSQMELLEAFSDFSYPNEIGPGVYDIHAPRIPTVEEMVELMERALRFVPKERLWVNPDCGLKTRGWPETKEALANMVAAARRLRETHQ